MNDSEEVYRSLEKIKEEGYSLGLHLLVDCHKEGEETQRETLEAVAAALGRQREQRVLGAGSKPGSKAAPRRRDPEPVFQINTQDLSFMKSIGIDPTRRLRRRRRSS